MVGELVYQPGNGLLFFMGKHNHDVDDDDDGYDDFYDKEEKEELMIYSGSSSSSGKGMFQGWIFYV